MNVSAVTASAVYLPMQALAPSVPGGSPVPLSIVKVPTPATTPRVSPVAQASRQAELSGRHEASTKAALPARHEASDSKAEVSRRPGEPRRRLDVYA